MNYENLTNSDLIALADKAIEQCNMDKLDLIRRIQSIRMKNYHNSTKEHCEKFTKEQS